MVHRRLGKRGRLGPRASRARVSPAARVVPQEQFYGCPFINAVGEHDKADDRLRAITMRHKSLVLEHLAKLCAGAGSAEPEQMATRWAC